MGKESLNNTSNVKISLIIVILVAISIIPSSFAQQTIPIAPPSYMVPSSSSTSGTEMTITTDKQTYNYGDTITISGTTQTYLNDTPLTIIIRNSAGIVDKVDQVQVLSSKAFSDSFTPTGSTWQTGTYSVFAQYGSPNISAQTTFQFTGSTTTISTGTPIIVSTDKTSYTIGDTIVVSGYVSTVVPGTPLNIQILDSNTNLIQDAQIDVSSNGQFSKSFLASSPLWKYSGTYTVKVQYGLPNVTAQTTFSFGSQLTPISNVFQINQPMTQHVVSSIQYTITGGTVRDMTINSQSTALFVSINSTTDGTITLQLPRTLIDAKTSSGQDAEFIVLIDGSQVKPQSESSDPNYRTLTIPFLQGDQDIEMEGITILSPLVPQIPPQHLGDGNIVVYITLGSGSNQGCVLTSSCYSPDVLHILPGTTITWINNDTVGHTATSGHPSDTTTGEIFDSSLIAAGKSYTSPMFVYNGTYPYFDQVHKWITGVVIVGNSITPQPVEQSSLSSSTTTTNTAVSPAVATPPLTPICGDHPCKSGELSNPSESATPNATSIVPSTISLIPTTVSSKIPAWVKNIFIWYGRGSISDDELLDAIKFLIQQGIIKV